MDSHEFGTPQRTQRDDPVVGALVEMIVAASDGTDDLWEIGDRVDRLIGSERVQLSTAD